MRSRISAPRVPAGRRADAAGVRRQQPRRTAREETARRSRAAGGIGHPRRAGRSAGLAVDLRQPLRAQPRGRDPEDVGHAAARAWWTSATTWPKARSIAMQDRARSTRRSTPPRPRSPSPSASLEQAEAALANAHLEFDRAKNLFEKGALPSSASTPRRRRSGPRMRSAASHRRRSPQAEASRAARAGSPARRHAHRPDRRRRRRAQLRRRRARRPGDSKAGGRRRGHSAS